MNKKIHISTSVNLESWALLPQLNVDSLHNGFSITLGFLCFVLFIGFVEKPKSSFSQMVDKRNDIMPVQLSELVEKFTDQKSLSNYYRKKTERITFRLTAFHRDILDSLCEKKGLTVSKLVIRAINEYVNNDNQQKQTN